MLGRHWDGVGTALGRCWDGIGTVLGRCWDGFLIGVRDQGDRQRGPQYGDVAEAEGTIKTRERGYCLSGIIPVRGGFAPIHALFVALIGA